jgi:tRNA(fMet)-specific endonuclease VapC
VAFLLDTDIVIHGIDGHATVLDNLDRHDGNVFISVLTLVELQRGLVQGSSKAAMRKPKMPLLLESIPVLAFTERAALVYGRLITQCGWTCSGDFDRMLAAHALEASYVLVTHNQADFRDVPGLSLADWTV